MRVAGQPVRIAPTVLVSDTRGRPIAGLPVTFTALGMATVTPAQVFTDRNGRAAPESWVLRSDGGEDSLVVSVENLGAVTFTASSLRFTSIDAGSSGTCGVAAGRAFCWGWNYHGRLGTGDSIDVHQPVLVTGSARYRRFTAGFEVGCGLTLQDEVLCAGLLLRGNPDHNLGTTPTEAGGGLRFSELAVPDIGPVCALGLDGIGYCWGDVFYHDANGQLDYGSLTPLPLPSQPGRLTTLAASGGNPGGIPESYELSCGLEAGGAVQCWWLFPYLWPQFRSTQSFQTVAAGARHVCALDGLGTVYCWGQDRGGTLGGAPTSPTPVPVSTNPALALDSGPFETCALTAAGVECWGKYLAPHLVAGTAGHGFTSLTVSSDHSCAIDDLGLAWCWGDNHYGQLGTGDTLSSATPLRVRFDP